MPDEIDNRRRDPRAREMPATASVPSTTGAVEPRAGGTGVTGTGEQTWLRSEQVQGLTLFTFDGIELGRIVDGQPGYFTVTTSVDDLGPTLYVPITAVSSVSAHRCFLNLPLYELRTMAWNIPPDEATATVARTEDARVAEADTRRIPWADATNPPQSG